MSYYCHEYNFVTITIEMKDKSKQETFKLTAIYLHSE